MQYVRDPKEMGVRGKTRTLGAVNAAAVAKQAKLTALAHRLRSDVVGKDVAFFASDIHHKKSVQQFWLGRVDKLYQMKKGGKKGSGKTKFVKDEWAVDVTWLEPVGSEALRYVRVEALWPHWPRRF